jgi:MFS family permease
MVSTTHHGERSIIATLSIAFGLMGLDRFVINPLFPVIAKDLGLGYRDIGLAAATLALAWGVAALIMGRLADRVGVKTILVPSILAFSLFAGLSGLATGLGTLLALRALTGLAEGTFLPACIVAATRASKPSRVGLNIGLLHMAAAFAGFTLAPLLATQLLKVLPSWHWVFLIAAAPGIILAYCVRRVLPPDPPPAPRRTIAAASQSSPTQRRIIANAAAMSCWLAIVATLGALLPSYLTDGLHLGLDQMGVALAGQGVGGLIGMIVVPALGDRFGHRAVAIGATGLKIVALGLLLFAPGAVAALFVLLFAIGFAGAGTLAITIGPLTGAAGDPRATTATGIVAGCGEILGGALAPAAAGLLAARLGIGIVPAFALGASILGLVALALGAAGPQRRPGPSVPNAA